MELLSRGGGGAGSRTGAAKLLGLRVRCTPSWNTAHTFQLRAGRWVGGLADGKSVIGPVQGTVCRG